MEELWDAHTAKMAEYGFDRLIYGFTRYRTSSSLGDPEDIARCVVFLASDDARYVVGALIEVNGGKPVA